MALNLYSAEGGWRSKLFWQQALRQDPVEDMSVIARIEEKLRKNPLVQYSVVGATITVKAADCEGFSVWLTERNPGYTIGYDGWHNEFDDVEEALAAFAFGLSDDCRLKVVRRGNFDCVWIVEVKDEEGDWIAHDTTGLLLTPFWRKKSIVYRQNRLLASTDQAGVQNC